MARATPGDIETGMSGSRIRFDSAMALLGDSSQLPVMTQTEYHSGEYDDLIEVLHNLAYDKINSVNTLPEEYFDDIVNNTAECIKKVKLQKKLEEEERAKKYDNWMKDFKEFPKKTKKELQKEINELSAQLLRCKNGSLPPFLAGDIQQKLEQRMLDFKNENYVKTDADKEYNKQWNNRMREWYENN